MNKYCVSVELSVLDNDLGGRRRGRGRNRIDKGTPPNQYTCPLIMIRRMSQLGK